MSTQSILAVGSLAIDTLETASGRRAEILGGSSTYFAVAAALFAPVRLVGIVGTDFPAEGRALLESRGVNLDDVQTSAGATFRWGGKYAADFSTRDTLFTELGVFEHFEPRLSPQNARTPIVYLGNIQPQLQLAVCDQMQGDPLVIADTMNLWIDLNRPELLQVLARTKIFLINDEEAEQLTGHTDLEQAAAWLMDTGPAIVVIKLGSAGAFIAYQDFRRHIPVFPGITVQDPTGAGDSFAGGLVGHIANHGVDDMAAAVIQGTAVASFTVEGFGLEGLERADRNWVGKRVEAIKSRTS